MNKIRTLVVVGTFLALFLALFFFIQFAGFLFTIQEKYANSPAWLMFFYVGGVFVISFFGLLLVYKVTRIGSNKKIITKKKREVFSDEDYKQKISQLKQEGAETSDIEQDWINLISLRENESVTIAMFGEINSGKSSIINTLLGTDINTSAVGGSTNSISEYKFSRDKRNYTIIDMPGFNETKGFSQDIIKDKAIKSHLVVFVMDEDLTKSSYELYEYILSFGKPIIIAINKADYYSLKEQNLITEKIKNTLKEKKYTAKNNKKDIAIPPVIWVSSNSTKIVEKHFSDGTIENNEVVVAGDVESLIYTVEELTFDRLALDNMLNNSYYQSLEIDMDRNLDLARREKAERIVKTYSQKAIFGGMAAVGPGTDILLQGYLGMGMAKSICAVYKLNVKEVDLETIMSMLGNKMKKELAVILALVGNVFKAFPGVGTVAGGALHAVAYGIIFEAVGKAMIACIEQTNGIKESDLLVELEGQISGNMGKYAKRMAEAVLFKK